MGAYLLCLILAKPREHGGLHVMQHTAAQQVQQQTRRGHSNPCLTKMVCVCPLAAALAPSPRACGHSSDMQM